MEKTFTHEYEFHATISIDSGCEDPTQAVEDLLVGSYSVESAVTKLTRSISLLKLLKDLDHTHTRTVTA